MEKNFIIMLVVLIIFLFGFIKFIFSKVTLNAYRNTP